VTLADPFARQLLDQTAAAAGVGNRRRKLRAQRRRNPTCSAIRMPPVSTVAKKRAGRPGALFRGSDRRDYSS
jgi:hypothetical protein